MQEGNAGEKCRRGTPELSAGVERRRGSQEWGTGEERQSGAQEGYMGCRPFLRRGGVAVGGGRMFWEASKGVHQRGILGITPGVLLLGAAACPGGCYHANPRTLISYTT